MEIKEQEQPVEEQPQTEEAIEEETEPTTDSIEESETSESEEQPKEEEDDFYTPETDTPKRTEKEKAEYTLKSVVARYTELGGDPSKIIGTSEKKEDVSQFVTKRDFAEESARKVSRSPKELAAIMAWVDKGLTVEDAHLIANKGRIKSTFSEIDRGNVRATEATGAGQKKPVINAPAPNETLLMQWQRAKMVYDPVSKTAKGKFNEVYYDGKERGWVSRRIK